MSQSQKTKSFVTLAMLSAIILVLGITGLGMIPLPAFKFTILHIPVIIGACMYGPKFGGMLGGVFGITSIISNTINPGLTSFAFSPFITLNGKANFASILVAVLPRVMIGVVAGLVFKWLANKDKSKIGAAAAAGFIGTITNTTLVFSLLLIFFKSSYQLTLNKTMLTIIQGAIVTNFVFELIAAVILVPAIVKPLVKIYKKN